MNTIALNPRQLRLAVPATLCLLLVSGCLEKHIVWSPDGSQAAVIARDGLHVCNPAGQLSPLLLPNAYMVAWLKDSQRLVVARTRQVDDWATIAHALGPERSAQVAALSQIRERMFLPEGTPSGKAAEIVLSILGKAEASALAAA